MHSCKRTSSTVPSSELCTPWRSVRCSISPCVGRRDATRDHRRSRRAACGIGGGLRHTLDCECANAFGVDLSTTTSIWVILAFAAICLAIVNLWRSNWVRRVIASVAIVLFAVTGTVAINADFGLDRTVADLAGISIEKPIALPKPAPTRTPLARGALWATWVAPKDQPAKGTTGTVIIPNTLSDFHSRPAGLYLPPAALVKNPQPYRS